MGTEQWLCLIKGSDRYRRGHPAKWFSGGILQSSMDIEDFKVTNNKDH